MRHLSATTASSVGRVVAVVRRRVRLIPAVTASASATATTATSATTITTRTTKTTTTRRTTRTTRTTRTLVPIHIASNSTRTTIKTTRSVALYSWSASLSFSSSSKSFEVQGNRRNWYVPPAYRSHAFEKNNDDDDEGDKGGDNNDNDDDASTTSGRRRKARTIRGRGGSVGDEGGGGRGSGYGYGRRRRLRNRRALPPTSSSSSSSSSLSPSQQTQSSSSSSLSYSAAYVRRRTKKRQGTGAGGSARGGGVANTTAHEGVIGRSGNDNDSDSDNDNDNDNSLDEGWYLSSTNPSLASFGVHRKRRLGHSVAVLDDDGAELDDVVVVDDDDKDNDNDDAGGKSLGEADAYDNIFGSGTTTSSGGKATRMAAPRDCHTFKTVMEDESNVERLRRAYEQSLHGPSSSSSSLLLSSSSPLDATTKTPVSIEALRSSEDAYRAYGSALKSLTMRWAFMKRPWRVNTNNETNNGNTDMCTPFHYASKHLRTLENLREHRLLLLANAANAAAASERNSSFFSSSNDNAKRIIANGAESLGHAVSLLFRAATATTAAMFSSPSSSSDNDSNKNNGGGGNGLVGNGVATDEEYRRLTNGLLAHDDASCLVDANLCLTVMRSAMHWRYYVLVDANYGYSSRDQRFVGGGGGLGMERDEHGNDDDVDDNYNDEHNDDDDIDDNDYDDDETRIAKVGSPPPPPRQRRRGGGGGGGGGAPTTTTMTQKKTTPTHPQRPSDRTIHARRAAQSLATDLTAMLQKMIIASRKDNVMLRPTRRVYHAVMEMYARTGSVQRASEARALLRLMRRESDSGRGWMEAGGGGDNGNDNSSGGGGGGGSSNNVDAYDNYALSSIAPTRKTYHLVLKAYREAADGIVDFGDDKVGSGGAGITGGTGSGTRKNFDQRIKSILQQKRNHRRSAAIQAGGLLYQMEAEAKAAAKAVSDAKEKGDVAAYEEAVAAASQVVVPNAFTYNLVLWTLRHAGQHAVPDLVARADSLAASMMTCPEHLDGSKEGGRVAFEKWLSDGLVGNRRPSGGQNRRGRGWDQDQGGGVFMVPDMFNCHRLIDLYSSAVTCSTTPNRAEESWNASRACLDKAKALLERMEEFFDLGGAEGVSKLGIRVHGREVAEGGTYLDNDEIDNDDDDTDEHESLDSEMEVESTEEDDDDDDDDDSDMIKGLFVAKEEATTGEGKDGGSKGETSTIRKAQEEKGSVFPNTTTYNGLLFGLCRFAGKFGPKSKFGRQVRNKASSFSSSKSAVATVENDALYVMDMLDRMVAHAHTSPTKRTYSRALRIWELSGSHLAGEKAEEILSRMEIRHACIIQSEIAQEGDGGGGWTDGLGRKSRRGGGGGGIRSGEWATVVKPDISFYRRAISCWETAAAAGVSGAAERASAVLERMEGQCRPHRMSSTSISSFSLSSLSSSLPPEEAEEEEKTGLRSGRLYPNESIRPDRSVYNAVIAVCAATTTADPAAADGHRHDALRVAFGTYHRMIERGVVPSAKTYALLLSCCARLLPGSAEAAASAGWGPTEGDVGGVGGGGDDGDDRLTPAQKWADQRAKLSTFVFEAARDAGKVDKEVLAQLKDANKTLFKSYRPTPSHWNKLGKEE